jgi:fructose-bisphosphate aldolase class 1
MKRVFSDTRKVFKQPVPMMIKPGVVVSSHKSALVADDDPVLEKVYTTEQRSAKVVVKHALVPVIEPVVKAVVPEVVPEVPSLSADYDTMRRRDLYKLCIERGFEVTTEDSKATLLSLLRG